MKDTQHGYTKEMQKDVLDMFAKYSDRGACMPCFITDITTYLLAIAVFAEAEETPVSDSKDVHELLEDIVNKAMILAQSKQQEGPMH